METAILVILSHGAATAPSVLRQLQAIRRADVARSTANTALYRLCERGLVDHTPGVARSSPFRLTPKGRTAMARKLASLRHIVARAREAT